MNQSLFYYLNSFVGKTEWFDALVYCSAEYFGWWLLAGAAVLVWAGKNRVKNYFLVFSSVGLAWFAAQVIKFFYFSPRPFLALSDATQLIMHGANDSFPSGHAAVFFALAAAVFYFLPQIRFRTIWAAVFFTGAAIIGIARVMSGIHWPADILAGAAVGLFSAFIIKFLSETRLTSKNCEVNY